MTVAEGEVLAKLINGFGMLGAQMLSRTRPDLCARAIGNLKDCRDTYGDVFKKLHALSRRQGDESPLRMIEDIEIQPADTIGYFRIAQRCLLACAFLGHCAAHLAPASVTPEIAPKEKRLH